MLVRPRLLRDVLLAVSVAAPLLACGGADSKVDQTSAGAGGEGAGSAATGGTFSAGSAGVASNSGAEGGSASSSGGESASAGSSSQGGVAGGDNVPASGGALSAGGNSSAGAGAIQSESGGSVAAGGAGQPASGGSAGQSASGGSAGSAAVPSTSYLPWHVGNSWTYRVDSGGTITQKTTTIEAAESVGGTGPNKTVMAFRVVTKKGANGADQSISWQAPVGDKVVRYREQSFAAMTGMLKLEEYWSPYKLHVDESTAHTTMGASWSESYDETKLPVGGASTTSTQSDAWSVVAPNQSVTVPAGTFMALVLRKGDVQTGKTYWYVRGVGKVKESGAQTEELVSYVLVP